MKRMISLALALMMLLSLTASALAADEYYSDLLESLEWTSDDMTQTRTQRKMSVAAVIICYLLANPDDAETLGEISASGNAKICRYGSSTVDIYLPMTGSSKYLNLFVIPRTGKITNYGITKFYGSDEKTYYDVDMEDVVDILSDISESLNSD
ncbi:MAG: hypothetical protein IKP40_10920 [Clostridia bacterium]|nr:hypothetical protein [Clostridia bacterium]